MPQYDGCCAVYTSSLNERRSVCEQGARPLASWLVVCLFYSVDVVGRAVSFAVARLGWRESGGLTLYRKSGRQASGAHVKPNDKSVKPYPICKCVSLQSWRLVPASFAIVFSIPMYTFQVRMIIRF